MTRLIRIGLLGVLALPATGLLTTRYQPYEARVREAVGSGILVRLSHGEVLQIVRQETPSIGDAPASVVWEANPEPRTGLVSVLELPATGTPEWRIVVVRHHILCSVCRDVYAAAVYRIVEDELARVVLLDPWEMEGRTIAVDPFLSQFVGIPRDQRLTTGGNVDGLSGATKSVDGLVERLNEAGAWTGDLAVR